MAREHVYPVCGTGSKILSFKNLEVELDEKTVAANTAMYRNEDKSISFRKYTNPGHPNENKITQVIINRGEGGNASEVLVDLNDSDLPEGFLEGIGAVEYTEGFVYNSLFSFILYNLTPELHSAVPNTSIPYLPRDPLEAGTVICIGAKNFNQAIGNDYIIEFPQAFNEFTFLAGTEANPHARYLFHDLPPTDFSDAQDINDVRLNKTEWCTFMFTGTRWVLLGSNNWF
jgi:hypothetical protein